MVHFMKVAELDRKAMAEQNSLSLLPKSSTAIFVLLVTLSNFFSHDTPLFCYSILLILEQTFLFECEQRNP